MMVVKLLVKIAVMMMATTAFQRHRKRRGEGAPLSSPSLTPSLDGRRVSPLFLGLHGVAGARAPPILDLSLCLSLFLRFLDSALSPFLLYSEIRNSDWVETFAQIFIRKLAFLRPKKSSNRLTGGPRGGQARPLPRAPLGHRLALILLPIFSKYSKNILRPFLSRLDSV